MTNGPNEVIDDVKLLEQMVVENDDKGWRERDEGATDILQLVIFRLYLATMGFVVKLDFQE